MGIQIMKLNESIGKAETRSGVEALCQQAQRAKLSYDPLHAPKEEPWAAPSYRTQKPLFIPLGKLECHLAH